MNDKRRAEIARMLEHERKMQQHPKDLFPPGDRVARTITCRYCKKVFTWDPRGGRPRAFCDGICKDAYYKKGGPLPAMAAGGRGGLETPSPKAERDVG